MSNKVDKKYPKPYHQGIGRRKIEYELPEVMDCPDGTCEL